MFRVGPSSRPTVRHLLRPDFRLRPKEFHQLTTRLRPGNTAVLSAETSLLNRSKLGKTVWRECRAVFSMLQRSGMMKADDQCLRLIAAGSMNSSRGFHSSTSNEQKSDEDQKSDGDKKNKNDPKYEALKQIILKFNIILFISLIFLLPLEDGLKPTEVSWQKFVHQMLAKGEVQEIIVMWDLGFANVVLHEDAVVNGKPVKKRVFALQIPDVSKFEERLREAEQQLGISPGNGVRVVFERHKDSVWPSLAMTLLVCFVLLNLGVFLKNNFSKTMNIFSDPLTKAKFTLIDSRRRQGLGVKFADIAGMKEAKQEVMEFVDYLKRPGHYRRLGAKVPKGSLLLGPPGCGKTLLAKAVATEANVPFLSMNGSEFIEMVGGLGASRVRNLFKSARKMAPCIVYIDEIDAIGGKRSASDFGTSEKMQTLLQLLIEMDGMASNEGVIMLASTNRAEVLDEALLRPGRFDRHILIASPTLIERKEIFEVYLKRLQLDRPYADYSGRLAQLTPSYSGADIANICNEAALHAAGLKQKKVTGADLEYAINRVKFGRVKMNRTVLANERKQIAYYLAGQTLVGWMLKNTDALMKVSIIQYTSRVGSMQHFRPSRFLAFKDELCDRMTMYLGGKAAELIIFQKNSTQAAEDLKKVTDVAYDIVTSYGMNDAVGEVSFPPPERFQRRFYSRKLHGLIDLEARRLISDCFATSQKILTENADKLTKLAEELLKKETLTYEEICEIIGPPPGGHKNLVDLIEFGPAESATPSGETSSGENNSRQENSSEK